MISWMSIWSLLLIVVLATFSIVTVYVAFGGLQDIRKMLDAMSKDGAEEKRPPGKP